MIKVKLSSALAETLPERREQYDLPYHSGITVREIINNLSLHPGAVGLILVNSKLAEMETGLADLSEVKIYPIFGGG